MFLSFDFLHNIPQCMCKLARCLVLIVILILVVFLQPTSIFSVDQNSLTKIVDEDLVVLWISKQNA